MDLADLLAVENGTKFYIADLHIYSYGTYASYGVKDSQMTPTNIIACTRGCAGYRAFQLPKSFLVYFETYEQIKYFYAS